MSRKTMYLLVTILCSLLFIQRVDAVTIEYPYADYDTKTFYLSANDSYSINMSYNNILMTYDPVPTKFQNNYNRALEYYNNNLSTEYDSYVIFNQHHEGGQYTNGVKLFVFNSSKNNIQPSITMKYTKSSNFYSLGYKYYVYNSNTNARIFTFYDNNQMSSTYSSKMTFDANQGYLNYDSNIFASGIYSTNVDFKYTNQALISGDTWAGRVAMIKDKNRIMKIGDSFFVTKPEITITKSDNKVTILDKEYVTSATLNVAFSSIDNDKYLYMYKYGADSEWTTVTLTQSNNFSKTYNENNTLYVQILDKNTHEVITSNTATVSSINYVDGESSPYLTLGLIDDSKCLVNDYHLCETFHISSNITNFKKYSIYVTNDDDMSVFNKNSFNYTVYRNSTLLVKIIDNETMKVIDEKSFFVNSITPGTSALGQYVSLKCDKVPTNSMYDCKYYIYNYDATNYKYMYSENTGDFELIPVSDKKIPEIYENTIYPSIAWSVYKEKETDNFYIYKRSYQSYTNSTIKIIDINSNETVGIYTFTITANSSFDENTDMSKIEQFIYNHLLSKFYFVHQFKQIIEYVSSYNFVENAKAPKFTFDLSFLGLKPVEVNMQIDEHSRLLIHGYIKLFASISVVYTFIRETSKLFKH